MKRALISALITVFTLSSLTLPAFAAGNAKKSPTPVVTVAPATETLINGVPESQIIKPMITLGPFYEDYIVSSQSHIDFFKLIGSSYVDNRASSTNFVLTYNITQSTQQGSEWSLTITLTAEAKLAILSKAGISVEGGLKETRSTNEAVGVSGQMTIPAGKQGRLDAYYGGISTAGTYKYYYDTDGTISHYSSPLSATVHKNYLDVNFRPVTW